MTTHPAKRKSARSPKKAVRFFPIDVERIIRYVFPHFLTMPFNTSPPDWASQVFFRPYPTADPRHPERDPNLMIPIREGRRNLVFAAKCLESFGFDETFIESYIGAHRELEAEEYPPEDLFSNTAAFDFWFHFLFSLSGQELEKVLTPDLTSSMKWRTRLIACGCKWGDVRITREAAASITHKLLLQFHPALEFEVYGLITKIRRWEKERKEPDTK